MNKIEVIPREVLIVTHLNQLERVSEQLKDTLEQEARKASSDRRDEVANLLNSERMVASYSACVWWNGCYYCKDDSDSWYCVKCSFF